MTHRIFEKSESVERQVLLKKRIWASALTALVITASSQIMAVESTDDQLLSPNPVITVIEQNLSPLSYATTIAHSAARFASPLAAQVGASLAVGDQLQSSGGSMLQISCGDGSQISLSGSFNVSVISAAASRCAFELSQGNLVAEANGNVLVKSNGSVFNSAGSVTNIQVSGATQTQTPTQRWQVNLGQASLSVAGTAYTLAQNTGMKLSGASLTSTTLTANDNAKSANVLARLNATKTAGSRADITSNYTTARNQYLRLFGGQAVIASSALSAPERAMDEQQLGIESAADITDLSSLVTHSGPIVGNDVRRETWQLQNQGLAIGSSISTQVELPETVGFIPAGAITRDF
ncbi:MAG TPA: hypothetical protein DD827_05695 [Gammaproteobacteria bacterium]|nr:hypothetical protein [Gammaproteobacteria bacterium]